MVLFTALTLLALGLALRMIVIRPVARATASKIPVILAVLDGNLVCSYNVYYWHIFNNHPNYGCKSLEYSQNFRSITVSGLPYLMKNPHFDAVALVPWPASRKWRINLAEAI